MSAMANQLFQLWVALALAVRLPLQIMPMLFVTLIVNQVSMSAAAFGGRRLLGHAFSMLLLTLRSPTNMVMLILVTIVAFQVLA